MRDCCYECGRYESYWSAFKRWLRWTKLGRWYNPPPQLSEAERKFFRDMLLIIDEYGFPSLSQLSELKPFPKNAGATTVRFAQKETE